MANEEWQINEILKLNARTKPATTASAGIVKVGNGLYADSDGKLSVTPFYGFEIDMNVSDPTNCITYTGMASTMTQAERKTWAYNKVIPTVVKDGDIAYRLKKDNLALKVDGATASDLTGTDGDVCASIVPLWFKVSKLGKKVQVNISEYPQAGYVNAHTFDGTLRDYLHIGMFEATGTTCNSVYSTTEKPKVSQTLKTFRTQATAKNTGLDEQYAGVYTYLSHMLYSILFIFAYGKLDSQAAVGQGNVNTSAAIAVGKSELLTCSGEYGVTDAGSSHVMALYVVNPWGNVWKFMEGCMWSDGAVAMLTDQSDLYDIEGGYAGKPTTWRAINTGLGTAISGAYISEFLGDVYAAFFPCAASGGSSATYACDSTYTATGDRVCLAGGGWHYAAGTGLFQVYANTALASSHSYIGARLQIMHKN